MLSQLQLVMAALSAVLLFLHGLNGFSREIQQVGGAYLRSTLAVLTANRWRGFGLGAVMTVLIQSSSAVSALTLSLVESGMLTFRNCLGVLIGANVGTTATAWLVAWKLTGIGPFFIVIGGILGMLPFKARVAGKAIFYFGFIFFSLNIIDSALTPIRESPALLEAFTAANSPVLALLFGAIFTALVQSSSVTSGLVILMVQQSLLPMNLAIPIIVGANIGTTSTALLASIPMGPTAKRAALANLIFNVTGVVLIFPWLTPYTAAVSTLSDDPAMRVAFAHLFFNLGNSLLFLIFLKPFERLVFRTQPEGVNA